METASLSMDCKAEQMEAAHPRAAGPKRGIRSLLCATGLRAGRLQKGLRVLEIVDFEEADAALAVAFVDDGGVGAGREGRDDG